MQQKDRDIKISVVIPAYNIEKHIARAINSVLKQTLQPDEIIVVDDGSSDATSKAIKSFGSHVRYLFQKNSGLSAARNKGIKAANYEWIAFLDGDDLWTPEKLEAQLRLLRCDRNLTWVASNHFLSCNNNQKIATSPEIIKRLLDTRKSSLNFFSAQNTFDFSPSTMIIKQKTFEEIGFFQESIRYAEDVDMWWRIGYRWPEIGYVNEPLAIYHTGREGSLTASTSSRKILSTMSDIFTEHLELSAQYGKQDDIRPFVIKRLQKWLTINYRRKEFGLVRDILRRHKNLFPTGYYSTLLTLASLPTFTVRGGRKLLELLNDDASV